MEFTSPVFSALERRNCCYRERVLRIFSVKNLTVTTGTKEKCDIRGKKSFMWLSLYFLNAIPEK